jgi:hypothetical protein
MAKNAKIVVPNNDKADLGSRFTNGLANFSQNFFKVFVPNAKEYIVEHWIKIIVLIASATQTYSLIKFFAPAWAWWLPVVAVLLTEGATPFWQWREAEADAADGNVDDVEMNKQETIANGMVWTGLVAVCVTMIAGALIQVSNSEVLSRILKPNEAVTGALGWTAIVGVFLFGAVQMWADWQYHRADPMLTLERENRAKMRLLNRRRTAAIYRGEERTTKFEARAITKNYNTQSKVLGAKRGNERFRKATAASNTDNETGNGDNENNQNNQKKQQKQNRHGDRPDHRIR